MGSRTREQIKPKTGAIDYILNAPAIVKTVVIGTVIAALAAGYAIKSYTQKDHRYTVGSGHRPGVVLFDKEGDGSIQGEHDAYLQDVTPTEFNKFMFQHLGRRNNKNQ